MKEDTQYVELEYPRDSNIKYIKIGLCDIRAADDIRISYDFERDGWKIEQMQVFEWDSDDDICDPKWKESAFIPAWQFENKKEG